MQLRRSMHKARTLGDRVSRCGSLEVLMKNTLHTTVHRRTAQLVSKPFELQVADESSEAAIACGDQMLKVMTGGLRELKG